MQGLVNYMDKLINNKQFLLGVQNQLVKDITCWPNQSDQYTNIIFLFWIKAFPTNTRNK